MANRERAQLLEEASEKEEELRLSYEKEKQDLQERISLAERKLSVPSEFREQEQFITDQIISAYSRIIEGIKGLKYEAAIKNFDLCNENAF